MKFYVNEDKWLRGTGTGRLRNDKGEMCCLGFCALQLGATNRDIRPYVMPSQVHLPDPDQLRPAVALQADAALINDRQDITDTTRKRLLRALFKTHGHQLVFRKGK